MWPSVTWCFAKSKLHKFLPKGALNLSIHTWNRGKGEKCTLRVNIQINFSSHTTISSHLSQVQIARTEGTACWVSAFEKLFHRNSRQMLDAIFHPHTISIYTHTLMYITLYTVDIIMFCGKFILIRGKEKQQHVQLFEKSKIYMGLLIKSLSKCSYDRFSNY